MPAVPSHPNKLGSEARAKILSVLALHPDGTTVAHLAKLIGRQEQGTGQHLNILYTEGKVSRRAEPTTSRNQAGTPRYRWFPIKEDE